MHDVARSSGKRAQWAEIGSQARSPYPRKLLSRQVDDVSTRSGLAIGGPCVHKLATFIQGVATTVGLLGLVPDNMRERRFGDLAGEVGDVASPNPGSLSGSRGQSRPLLSEEAKASQRPRA
jgi:hypothetical protein